MKKHKRFKDERIEKESDRLSAVMYIYMVSVLTVMLIGKLVIGIAFQRYIIEVLCLITSSIYMIFSLKKYNLRLFASYDDEILKEVKRSILSKCGMICFWIIIVGEFILFYMEYLKTIDIVLYLIVWMTPALVITVYSIKHGLLLWGGTKRKASGKNELAKRTFIGALFFGVIMGGPQLYREGAFHGNGLLAILGYALGWGIPFYFVFKLFVNTGEKNADKLVNEIESEADLIHEKQTDENC